MAVRRLVDDGDFVFERQQLGSFLFNPLLDLRDDKARDQ
jgi:hypothetical protein